MTERIDRRACKARVRELLATAQVSPGKMVALWLGLRAALSVLEAVGGALNVFSMFLTVLTVLMSLTLDAGFVLYCMAIRRGERAEYMSIFDGFPLAWKIILLAVVKTVLIALWSLLFVIPGLIAFYRYRFALYNLLENPEISVREAIDMSKRQTDGFKGQVFLLDLSYLGWGLLAALPDILYRSSLQAQIYAVVGSSSYWNLQEVSRYINPNVFGVPSMAWQALIVVWAILISVLYIAHYQCVELDYFETAKRVSGVGSLAPTDSDSYASVGDGDF